MITKLAVLAPEIPSVSATFVYRELLALRRAGVDVSTFSLRPVTSRGIAPDGLTFLGEVQNVYGRGMLAILLSALLQSLRQPLPAMRCLTSCLKDLFSSDLRGVRARAVLVGQAVAGLSLARDLRRRDIEHLDIQFSHNVANVGMYAAMASGIPFSVVAHANDIFVHGHLLREKLERAKVFRTISESNRRILLDRYGKAAKDVVVIRCGVATHSFPNDRSPVESRFLFVGRLVEKKGADLLLEALARISATHHGVTLDIIGDGPERPELERRAHALGLSQRVNFLGVANTSFVMASLQSATALVLPCRIAKDGDRDGVPVVLMEAMAAGVPVVTSDLEGVDELVRDQITGFTFPVGDVAQLTARLNSVLEDEGHRERLAEAAKVAVRELHDVDHTAAKIIDALEIQQSPRVPRGTPADDGILVVTPFRNEAEHLPRIIACMEAQTRRPAHWVLVDDGSTDAGPDIVREAADRLPWIELVQRSDRGARVLGSGVIEAFEEGLSHARDHYDFVAKMDADLSIGPEYFEHALSIFAREPRLAALSGKVYRPDPAGAVEEFMIDDMVAGQLKLYRRTAFEEIGGFVRGLLWDGIDYHRCRQRGWSTRSSTSPALRIVHHRLMGSSDGGVLKGRLRLGRGQWFMGTHPAYLLASAFWRAFERPYVIGGVLILAGYVRSALLRLPRYGTPRFREELHDWQLTRLASSIRGVIR